MNLIWLMGLRALALFAGMGGWLSPLQPDIVALQFAFLPRDFGEVVHQWGPAGIAWPYELAATAATLKWAGLIAWGLTLAWAQAKSLHR